MSDPTFNSVQVRRATAGATEDFLTFDSVDMNDGNGSALRVINNSATEGLSLTLGRLSVRRADATTVRMDLAVARDPSVSSGDDTPPLLSLVSGAGGPQVVTAAGSTLAAGGALNVSGTTTLGGALSVTGNATLNGGLSVNGNVGVTGTVDGRDVSSDGTRLDQHLANTANPHATTAAQVGALSLGGGALSGSLSVRGALYAGNSDIYFTETTHNHTGFGNNAGYAALENAANYDALMILGRAGTRRGRSVKLWDYLQVNGLLEVAGNVAVGLTEPRTQMHVLGGIASGLDFNSPGSMTFYPPDGYAWFHIDNGPAGGRPMGRLRFSHGGFPGKFELMSIAQNGDVVVNGRLIARNKVGFVADQFVNKLGVTLEAGDVVVIGDDQTSLYYSNESQLPAPEVDVTQRAYDTRVCGVVIEAYASGKQQPAVAEDGEATLVEPEVFEPGRTSVAPGQIGLMVTQGAFNMCKVDADIAPIQPGDLLTTSATPGHAQKVLDRAQATGAILGKALAGLAQGKASIPIMVLLQ